MRVHCHEPPVLSILPPLPLCFISASLPTSLPLRLIRSLLPNVGRRFTRRARSVSSYAPVLHSQIAAHQPLRKHMLAGVLSHATRPRYDRTSPRQARTGTNPRRPYLACSLVAGSKRRGHGSRLLLLPKSEGLQREVVAKETGCRTEGPLRLF